MKQGTPSGTSKCDKTRDRVKSVGFLSSAVLGGAVLAIVPGASLFLTPPLAEAQNFSQRVVQGKVVDDTGTLVGGATVFLKDVKTRSVKSFTSTADGTFRFAQVGMIDDYEVWAEHEKKKSPTKTVSSFDSRKEVEFELKLK